MATIKLYLDTRKAGNKTDKQVQLKLAINHRSSTSYLLLKVALFPSQWDAAKCRIKDHHDKQHLNAYVNRKVAEAEDFILRLTEEGKVNEMTGPQLRSELEAELFGKKVEVVKPKDNPHTFGRWFVRFMERKTGRTQGIYQATYSRLEKWLGKSKLERLLFDDIKVAWLEDFDDFLAQTCCANSRAIHMRNIRAVFNNAIDNELTTNYPFRRFKIKGEKTKKRNFDVQTLRDIFNAEVEPWMERYRDFFKLSFMLIGINTVDLCQLREVKNGRVDYVRAKTHKDYSIKVESEAMVLIDKYRGEKQLLNFLDTTKHYRLFNNRLTYGLRKFKEMLNKERTNEIETLSMYWARHSWATIAASLDIPRDTIAAALGHGGNSVTDIYIEFDMRKVDEANRKVLDWVLYGVNPNAPKKRGRPRKSV